MKSIVIAGNVGKDAETRDAVVVAHLKADSGYESTETHRLSADQWRRICEIFSEPEVK